MGQYDAAIEGLVGKIKEHESEALKLKSAVNTLCGLDNRAALYEIGSPNGEKPNLGSIRPDQFYNRPLATVVREVLTMRKNAGLGPAKVDDILATMKQGGFQFSGKTEDGAKNGLLISMSKTRKVFHKLPNDLWGLTEWYPGARNERQAEVDEKALDGDEPVEKTESEAAEVRKKE